MTVLLLLQLTNAGVFMSEFKKELTRLVENYVNHEELLDKHGCTVDFIVTGMIESIASSVKISQIAKQMPKGFKL